MIRPVKTEEVTTLRQLAMETYRATFGASIPEADLQVYFADTYGLERLSQELADPESRHYFIVKDGRAVGFLKVNWGQAQTEQDLPNGFEIQRIYIDQAYQGQGLGKELFAFALEKAQESGCDWVWLGVWEHNYKAQAFYQKYGFEKFSEHAFVTGDTVDVDWLLKKSLK